MATLGRPEPRVTLADVARRAGVSVTTASFVLAGRTDMRIPTRTGDRVRQAARVLNYSRQPRTLAGRGPTLPVIAFITDSVASDHFAGDLIRGGIAAAAERGHGLVTAETEGDRPLEAGLVQNLLDRGVESFIYSAAATREVRLPRELADRRTVLLNCLDRRADTLAIVPDDHGAGVTAVEALLDAGHSDAIWLVGEARRGPVAARQRHAAITETLASRGLRLAGHTKCLWWPADARTAFRAVLEGRRRPSAVIAMNDRVALGVYQAAELHGLAIPKDLSVVSFDNSELAWWLTPELSSVGLPYFEMGRRAVEVVLGGEPDAQVELLPMPMHLRDSIDRPPTGTAGARP